MKLMKQSQPNGEPRFFPYLLENFFDKDFPSLFPTSWGSNVPAVNIAENDDNFRLELAVPGMKKSDFRIKLESNMLEISSEKKQESQSEIENYTRREFNHSAFTRIFTLPDSVDGERINAEYVDGMLKITVPKKEEAKRKQSKQIDIS
jgi:HSP20 family protein